MLSAAEAHTAANGIEVDTAEYYEIIWITRGSGNLLIDDQKASFEMNHLFCLRPNQIRRFEEREILEGFTLRIWPAFLKGMEKQLDLLKPLDLLQLFSSTKGILIGKEVANDLQEIIQKMTKVLSGDDLFKLEIIQRYFEIFLMNLSRQGNGFFQIATRTRNIEIVDHFLELLEKNYKEKKLVSDYAYQLSITPNHLNEIVRKTTGNSAGQQIRQRVALEAKRHALYSSLCMKEVAYFLGFYDLGHFSKFFKKETGKTFTAFKRERLTLSFASMAD
jgi:AraC-like DNA-binding protein